jgi:hypothetical protein
MMFGNREYRRRQYLSRHVSQDEVDTLREENNDLRRRVSELEKLLAACHVCAVEEWESIRRYRYETPPLVSNIMDLTEKFAK